MRAERGEVGSRHLAIYHGKAALLEIAAEMRKRDFRGVADERKHRFTVEDPADCHAIESARQPAVDPGFDAVGKTQLVQFMIGGLHFWNYPGAADAFARFCAAGKHLGKGGVEPHFVALLFQRFGERMRNP